MIIRPPLIRLFVLIGLASLAGCSPAAQKPLYTLPLVHMQIGSRNFELEVAATDATRELGLMRRDSMPADHGMLFLFPSAAPRDFWMKDCRFPQDILFIGADGRILSIKQMKAYDQSTVPSDGPMKYAIELNKGVAATTGVKVGDKLNIPAEAGTAKE
jgi:hypothetical protein